MSRNSSTLRAAGLDGSREGRPRTGTTGTEVLQFHRNSGHVQGRADRCGSPTGSRATGFGKRRALLLSTRREQLALAAGDTIRITGQRKTKDGSTARTTAASTGSRGSPRRRHYLTNGWVVATDFGHLAHGYVTTSHASQGKTVDRVLIAMGNESRPGDQRRAVLRVGVAGREKATIYTDMARRPARGHPADRIRGSPPPNSWGGGERKKSRLRSFTRRVSQTYERFAIMRRRL